MCVQAFKGKCHCGKQNYTYWNFGEEVFVVNCTNTMFRTTEMLEDLPSETEVLIFNGNVIPELDWNLFGIWHEHTQLKVVDLTNNRIRSIAGKTFHKVSPVVLYLFRILVSFRILSLGWIRQATRPRPQRFAYQWAEPSP